MISKLSDNNKSLCRGVRFTVEDRIKYDMDDLYITGTYDTIVDPGLWRFYLAYKNHTPVNAFLPGKFIPNLYHVKVALQIALKTLDVARSGNAELYQHSLYSSNVQLMSFYIRKIEEQIERYTK